MPQTDLLTALPSTTLPLQGNSQQETGNHNYYFLKCGAQSINLEDIISLPGWHVLPPVLWPFHAPKVLEVKGKSNHITTLC